MLRRVSTLSVVPAKAGTQYSAASADNLCACDYWMPAFAGMTAESEAIPSHHTNTLTN